MQIYVYTVVPFESLALELCSFYTVCYLRQVPEQSINCNKIDL